MFIDLEDKVLYVAHLIGGRFSLFFQYRQSISAHRVWNYCELYYNNYANSTSRLGKENA